MRAYLDHKEKAGLSPPIIANRFDGVNAFASALALHLHLTWLTFVIRELCKIPSDRRRTCERIQHTANVVVLGMQPINSLRQLPSRLAAVDRGLGCRLAQPIGPRTAVLQTGKAFSLIAVDPFLHRARANAHGSTDGLWRLPTENHVDHVLSTARRQAGILVDVHSALPRTVDVSTTSASSAGAGWTTY